MERKTQEKTRTNSEGTPKIAKKPYASPQLIEYGNVAKLTQGLTGSGTDGGPAGMSLMMCL